MRAVAVTLLVSFGLAAAAQEFPRPGTPVAIVGGFPNASGVDIYSRMIAERLAPALGVPVVVDNRVGASGNVAMEHVARSAPDGHTILFATSAMLAINPALYPRMPVDTGADFRPLMTLADVPNALAVSIERRPQFTDCQTVIAAARMMPGRMNYASTGNGASTHLAGAQFAVAAGLNLVHVPYRGGPFAVTALLAGEVDIFFHQTGAIMGAYRQGQVRLLGVTGAARVPALPEVPTIAEACNLPGFASTTWYGLVLPARTPDAIAARLYREIRAIVTEPGFERRIVDQGLTPMVEDEAATRARLAADLPAWRQVVRSSGARID